MNTFVERLIADFADAEFAHGYMEDHGNTVIAAQIKALREQRGLSQTELAQLTGMKQTRISALENIDYDGWTTKTLRKLAEAFDVHLKVAFVPFSEGIMDVANLSRERLEVAPRTEDLAELLTHSIRQCDNTWKAIDTSYLAPVIPLEPSMPLDPDQSGWQQLRAHHG